MPPHIERHVVLHPHVVRAMDGHRTLEAVVDAVALHVGVAHTRRHVAVRAVPSQNGGLAAVGELHVLHAVRAAVHGDGVGAEHLLRRVVVALDDDVAAEQAHLHAQADDTAVRPSVRLRHVVSLQRRGEHHRPGVGQAGDGYLLHAPHVAIRGGHDQPLAGSEVHVLRRVQHVGARQR